MSDSVKSFEDLQVFQRAYSISLDIHRASLVMPKMEQYALADQMRRASKSICGNIAEGFGRQRASSAEFKRFLVISIGSCDEMQVWVRYASDLGYVAEETAKAWKREYIELAKMLQWLVTKLDIAVNISDFWFLVSHSCARGPRA